MPASADPRRRPVLWNAVAPLATRLAQFLDGRFHWDRLPYRLGLFTLLGLRHSLREHNLYDPDLPGRAGAGPPAAADRVAEKIALRRFTRSIDGSGTHPVRTTMGAAGTRFARNLPVVPEPDLANSMPSAALVSEALLRRRQEFIPAPSLNLLAVAWLQFEVHDWFAHRIDLERDPVVPPLPPLKQDPDGGNLPILRSDQSHWWDASQLYGANRCFAEAIRSADSDESGKVKIGAELLTVIEEFQSANAAQLCQGTEPPHNPVPNLWLGLALFHDVFAREHNLICDRLRERYPKRQWTGDELYDQARTINAAVMAKIHTLEWTPALLPHRTTAKSIESAWWGLLGKDKLKRFGRIGAGEILSGIPGSWMDDDVPYALTEEFAAVYRMHPLLPDEVTFYDAAAGAPRNVGESPTVAFEDLVVTAQAHRASADFNEVGPRDAWYSLGIAYPGAMTLHNYPKFRAKLQGGEDVDLGFADIVRTRECGVPRYNEFRRRLRMPPATTFRALAHGNLRFADELKNVYGDVEKVDLVVGLLADRKPERFAISDTAFRIFLLMAARRLRSDRFFTMDYTPRAYTQFGLEWIDRASMVEILRRHHPALAPALFTVSNVFKPWPRTPARAPAPG